MPTCTRKGCGKEYDADASDSCVFHPGAPVFHEGLKSWSCCSDVHKPVLDFDEFMNIPGCMKTERHSNDVPQVEPPKEPPQKTSLQATEISGGKEVYTTRSVKPPVTATPPAPSPTPPPVQIEEEDDLSISVTPGTTCKRRGCNQTFVSDEENRIGDGEGTVCTYHPSAPIFHEGSKGYLCCKRRVLEFDEFLKIEGCKTGRHVFATKVTTPTAEELTSCRVDHYQTVDKVYVSIFAKQADKERSTVNFKTDQIDVTLYLPGSKKFVRTLKLFGPIDPEASSFTFFGTKVELQLKKLDGRSWTLLEKTTQDLGNISLTFGVSGRTGTIGAKNLVLDASNQARAVQ